MPKHRAVIFLSLSFFFFLGSQSWGAAGGFSLSPYGEKPYGQAGTPSYHEPPTSTEAISLAGSRGETLGFLIKYVGRGCEPITFSTFKSPSSQNLVFPIDLLQMVVFRTKHPSYRGAFIGDHYDPLLPLLNRTVCADPAHQTQWVWADLKIPDETEPGDYEGALGKIKIHLRVWKMTIPKEQAFPLYSELSTWYVTLGHYGKWHEGEGELGVKYLEQMKKHRMVPLKTWIKRGDLGPIWNLVGPFLPPGTYWNVPGDSTEAQPKGVAYWDWLQSQPAHAHPLMIYLRDEPPREEFPKIIQEARLIHAHTPSAKVMVTVPAHKELESSVDIFVPVMNQFEPAEYPRLQAQGKEVWWYVSCMSHGCGSDEDDGTPDFVIDRPAAWIRSIPWIARPYGISAFLYYSVVNGYQFVQRDPWKDLWDFTGNGDGTLFYPGHALKNGFSEETPVVSVRLKEWREASFDAEYLKWLKKGVFDLELKTLTRGVRSWSKNYEDYAKLRRKIGDYLNGAL